MDAKSTLLRIKNSEATAIATTVTSPAAMAGAEGAKAGAWGASVPTVVFSGVMRGSETGWGNRSTLYTITSFPLEFENSATT